MKFSGAWYLPVKRWGNIDKYQYKNDEPAVDSDLQNIGCIFLFFIPLELTKQAIKYLIAPYKEGAAKKIKLTNKGLNE